jgi:uroporphyrinogen III methyltransferase/synthase
LAEGTVDWITLTSPAITERLHALLPEAARARVGTSIRLASISAITSAAAAQLGWTVAAEAREATWPGLVQAIAEQCAKAR